MRSTDTPTAPNSRKLRLERQIAELEAARDEFDPDSIDEEDRLAYQRLTETLQQKKELLRAITWR